MTPNQRIKIGDTFYRPIVLLINTKLPNGVPRLMTHIPDDHKVELAGGEEFMIAWAPVEMTER